MDLETLTSSENLRFMMFKKQPNSFWVLKSVGWFFGFIITAACKFWVLKNICKNQEIWDMGLGENSKPAIWFSRTGSEGSVYPTLTLRVTPKVWGVPEINSLLRCSGRERPAWRVLPGVHHWQNAPPFCHGEIPLEKVP